MNIYKGLKNFVKGNMYLTNCTLQNLILCFKKGNLNIHCAVLKISHKQFSPCIDVSNLFDNVIIIIKHFLINNIPKIDLILYNLNY